MARIVDRDSSIVAPMHQWAEAQGTHGRARVYGYMFTYPHSYMPRVTISDLDPATAGACHPTEVRFWLDTTVQKHRAGGSMCL